MTNAELNPSLDLLSAVHAAEAELTACLARAAHLCEVRQLRDELEGDLAELNQSLQWLRAEQRALRSLPTTTPFARLFPVACGLGAMAGIVLALWAR